MPPTPENATKEIKAKIARLTKLVTDNAERERKDVSAAGVTTMSDADFTSYMTRMNGKGT